MNLQNILKKACIIIPFAGMISCQKMNRPALPKDFPVDNGTLPGGDLRFFTSFDSTSEQDKQINVRFRDSISGFPCFFPDPSITSGTGISGTDYVGTSSGYLQYLSANDFGSATSFTVAFWLKKTPQAAGSGTNFVFGLNTSRDIWTKLELFLEFEDAGNPSTTDSAAAKFYIQDQWFEFIKNSSKDTRMPKVLDGTWHHLAFTYDETTSKLYTYIDGVVYLPNRSDLTDVVNNGAPRGKLSFTDVTAFTLGGPSAPAHTANDWMGTFDGELDQFRLYNKALSADDVMALYNGKM